MGWESVARDQFLFRRGGRFYIRRRVPKELVSRIGKEHVVKSLFTSDYRTATELAIKRAAEIQLEFDAQRGQLFQTKRNDEGRGRVLDELPLRVIEQAVFSWFRYESSLIGASSDEVNDVLASGEIDALEFGALRTQQQLDANDLNVKALRLARSDPRTDELIRESVLQICDREGLTTTPVRSAGIEVVSRREIFADRSGSKYRFFRDLVRRATMELFRLKAAELSGQIYQVADEDIREAVKAPFRTKRGAINLGELIEEFKADPSRKGMRKKLELDYGLLFRALDEVIGFDRRLHDISRDDCKAVVQLLEALPANATKKFPGRKLLYCAEQLEKGAFDGLKALNEVTVTSYIHKMSALFNFGVNEERMVGNPAKGLRKNAKKHSSEDRSAFSDWQLRKIFAAPIYSGCQDDNSGWKKPGENRPRGTKFWIPLIALYHGMRLNEICQLSVDDVQTRNGVTYFDVKTGGERKRLKTKAAHRVVPLHPLFDQKKLNFAAYVSKMKNDGHEVLFPDLRMDSRGYHSDGFQKWFSRFLSSIGANSVKQGTASRQTTFHSFRHTWRDALRNAGVPQERVRILGGWKSSSTDENYGDGPTLKLKREDISKVEYPALKQTITDDWWN